MRQGNHDVMPKEILEDVSEQDLTCLQKLTLRRSFVKIFFSMNSYVKSQPYLTFWIIVNTFLNLKETRLLQNKV